MRDWDFNELMVQSFIGKNLYMLDRPIHMGIMLGIFSAGGIGFELQPVSRPFKYPRVSAILLIIFVTILAIDMLSSIIRNRSQSTYTISTIATRVYFISNKLVKSPNMAC